MSQPNHQTASKEFIFFTACSIILTAIGIDIILPAFADLRLHFGLDQNATDTANLIAYFFMGQITQVFFGYLTDRHGRIPIIRLGIIIYVLCGFATIFVPSLSWMLALRFCSGMGAAAVAMTSVAAVRDRYSGDSMARVMSFVLTILLLTPIFAPAIGAFILKFYSWKVVFIVPPVFAALVFVWSFRISESHPLAARSTEPFSSLFGKIKLVLGNWYFMRYTLAATLVFSILSCYISSSERIVGKMYQKPDLFPIIFGSMGILMACFSLSNSYFSRRFGAKNALRIYLMAYLAVSLMLLGAVLFTSDPPKMVVFLVFMALLLSLTLAADPNSSSIALEPMGENAGVAASVYGTIFFFVGSGLGTLVSNQLSNSLLPLAIATCLFSATSLLLVGFKKSPSK